MRRRFRAKAAAALVTILAASGCTDERAREIGYDLAYQPTEVLADAKHAVNPSDYRFTDVPFRQITKNGHIRCDADATADIRVEHDGASTTYHISITDAWNNHASHITIKDANGDGDTWDVVPVVKNNWPDATSADAVTIKTYHGETKEFSPLRIEDGRNTYKLGKPGSHAAFQEAAKHAPYHNHLLTYATNAVDAAMRGAVGMLPSEASCGRLTRTEKR